MKRFIRIKKIILLLPLILLDFCMTTQKSYAQHLQLIPIEINDCNMPYEERSKIDIQEVTIGDTILLKEIEKLIQEETEQSKMFREGYGFVKVFLENVFSSRDSQEIVSRIYYMTVDYTGLKTLKQSPKAYLAYPGFYSFVAGRLVFIPLYDLDEFICFGFTKRSMKKLRKIQDQFLKKKRREIIYDMEGNKVGVDKNFRIDYHKLHGGKYIYIYHDSTYEVKPDPYNPH